MGIYVIRRAGVIHSRHAVEQLDAEGNPLPNQEYLEDGHPELAGLSLGDAKRAKLAAAGVAFLAASKAGLSHGGKLFQLDESSQQNISALSTRAGLTLAGVAGVSWPPGFAFIATDNSAVPFTAAQFVAFGNAAADRVIALRLAYRALKDSILAAESAQALDAIDVAAAFA